MKTLLTIPCVTVGCQKVSPIPGKPIVITSSPGLGFLKVFESIENLALYLVSSSNRAKSNFFEYPLTFAFLISPNPFLTAILFLSQML